MTALSPEQLDALAVAEARNEEVRRLHQKGAYLEAIPLARQALAIREGVLGAEHLDVATSLNNLAELYKANGAYTEAEPLYERALRIREQALGAEHRDVATLLNNLAGLYQARGRYAEAEPLYMRAVRIRTHMFGAEHLHVAITLNNLAIVYQAQGRYAEAEPLYVRVLQICERALGTEHPHVATSLNNLAGFYRAQGRYAEAEPLYVRALRIREHVLGAEHPDVAASLNNLAGLYRVQGAYAQAEPLCERAYRIGERVLGPEHPDVAAMLNNLAALHKARGAYVQAQPAYERALRIWERVLGPEHPDVATASNNLAMLYQAQGAYSRAEPLYVRALRIWEHALGVEHPQVAIALNNLGGLYRELGAYARAEPLHERALQIRKQALGGDHPAVATSLTNLAMLYQAQGAYAQAESGYERALQIRERVLGSEHLDIATSLNNLAGLYQAQGAYARAEPLYERALRIRERVLGAEHPDVATSLNNLAALYHDQGATSRAQPLYERALQIREHVLGVQHPDTASLLNNLAVLFWSAHDVARALDYFVRGVAVQERYFDVTLATLSEARKRQLLGRHRTDAEALVSLHAHCAPDDIDAFALTLTATLRRKGRVLEEIISEHAALRSHLAPALQDELDVLVARKGELVTRRDAADPGGAAVLRSLAQDIERRERELSRECAGFRTRGEPPTAASVQAALPVNAALIEFVRYQRFDPMSRGQEWKESRYVAYVIPSDGPPAWVALGEAEPIEAAVAAALTGLSGSGHDAREPLRSLDKLIFEPIRRLLGPVDHILVSPDSTLHLVPFAALIDEDGQYLVDRLHITYVTSGRDLVRGIAPDAARSKPLVLALSDAGSRGPSIPGAEAEARALRKHFSDVDLHVGAAATKDRFTAAHGPLFVHVATHGFVRAPRPSDSPRAARSSGHHRDLPAASSLAPHRSDRPDIEDALDDAGLIFAGASDAEAILTAREISAVDLRGTQLVVLSACDTGVGELAHSEGVYGLRRALAIAGAETQVVSLWKVDDDATSQLMDCYYGGLRRGEGRSEALRQAQLALLHGEQYAHPFYWAAFVPIGDERPLSLTR